MRASKFIATLVLASFLSPSVAAVAAPRGGRGAPPYVRREQRMRPPRRPMGPRFEVRRPRPDMGRIVRRPVHGGPGFRRRPPEGHRGHHPGYGWDYGHRPRRRRSHDTVKGIAIGIGVVALLAALANMNNANAE